MLSPAQTNVTLYRQMYAAGYSPDEIGRADAAYDLAIRLFSGAFRGSGKPFVCHLAGTASIVTQLRANIDMVLAALLHAAYDLAVFSDGRRGYKPSHVGIIQRCVGEKAAALIAAYSKVPFEPNDVERLIEEKPQDMRKDIVILRVANFIDDIADGEMLLSKKMGSGFSEKASRVADLAELINQPQLAATVRHYVDDTVKSTVWAQKLPPKDLYTYRLMHTLPSYLRIRRKQKSLKLIGPQ